MEELLHKFLLLYTSMKDSVYKISFFTKSGTITFDRIYCMLCESILISNHEKSQWFSAVWARHLVIVIGLNEFTDTCGAVIVITSRIYRLILHNFHANRTLPVLFIFCFTHSNLIANDLFFCVDGYWLSGEDAEECFS